MAFNSTDLLLAATIVTSLLTCGAVWWLNTKHANGQHDPSTRCRKGAFGLLPLALIVVLAVFSGVALFKPTSCNGVTDASPDSKDASPSASLPSSGSARQRGGSEKVASESLPALDGFGGGGTKGYADALEQMCRVVAKTEEAEAVNRSYAELLSTYQQRINRLQAELQLAQDIAEQRRIRLDNLSNQLNSLAGQVEWSERKLKSMEADLAESKQIEADLRNALAKLKVRNTPSNRPLVESKPVPREISAFASTKAAEHYDDRGWRTVAESSVYVPGGVSWVASTSRSIAGLSVTPLLHDIEYQPTFIGSESTIAAPVQIAPHWSISGFGP